MAGDDPPESLSPTAIRVLAALRAQSALGASILKTQCELAGLNASKLSDSDMRVLFPQLVAALSRFVAPEKVTAFRRAMARWDNGACSSATAESAVYSALQGSAPMNGLAADVLAILSSATPLATPMLKAQALKANVDLQQLTAADVRRLLPALIQALERFVSPEKAFLVAQRTRALLGKL